MVNLPRPQVELLLDDIEALRQETIAAKADTPELRSLLRSILQRIEGIQAAPQVPLSSYHAVTQMLTQLLDAEGRLLLQRLPSDEAALPMLERHINGRQTQLESAEHTTKAMRTLIEKACVLLDQKGGGPDQGMDAKALCGQFEQTLRTHLHDDRQLRQEVCQLIKAMQASVQSFNALLQEVGDESGGMAEIEQLLAQEVPEDPKQAQALLQRTREALIAAGQQLSLIRGSVHHAMQAQMNSIETLSQRLRQAEAQANQDELTGLANRRQLGRFMSSLEEEAAALLMIDIDHFKAINDRHGHIEGDKILTEAAGLLASLVRTTDIAARFGGEEFCVVMPGINQDQAMDRAEHIRMCMAETPLQAGKERVSITVSIGVACRHPGESIPQWTKRSDHALYKAKQQGRNSAVCAD